MLSLTECVCNFQFNAFRDTLPCSSHSITILLSFHAITKGEFENEHYYYFAQKYRKTLLVCHALNLAHLTNVVSTQKTRVEITTLRCPQFITGH